MEEVEGYLAGERDYTQIRGNTGPLGMLLHIDQISTYIYLN